MPVPEFDEAVEHEIDSVVSVAELLETEQVIPVTIPGGTETTDRVYARCCRVERNRRDRG